MPTQTHLDYHQSLTTSHALELSSFPWHTAALCYSFMVYFYTTLKCIILFTHTLTHPVQNHLCTSCPNSETKIESANFLMSPIRASPNILKNSYQHIVIFVGVTLKQALYIMQVQYSSWILLHTQTKFPKKIMFCSAPKKQGYLFLFYNKSPRIILHGINTVFEKSICTNLVPKMWIFVGNGFKT